MGPLAPGQVVIVHFPFSDLTASKLRPAVILAQAGRGDWILCQITSKPYGDANAIRMDASDFALGSLHVVSFARPGKLFTAHSNLIATCVGALLPAKFLSIRTAVVQMIQNGS
jgi:mRNA interferase MazF